MLESIKVNLNYSLLATDRDDLAYEKEKSSIGTSVSYNPKNLCGDPDSSKDSTIKKLWSNLTNSLNSLKKKPKSYRNFMLKLIESFSF